ncbi:hypothetical protein ACFWY5_03325 [Nonomuraea sp. NPDC059007]|uniref:hypothetical protein n=1 Tax=Nonomuraea sp. NPDC059007 TaxID=3346692 RepID=UPI0036C75714
MIAAKDPTSLVVPDALFLAIGRVSIASAELETELRSFLEELFGWCHPSVLLLEGQNFEWLTGHIRLLLNWHANDPEAGRFGYSPIREHILAALDLMGPLREQRNLVVHGVWRTREYCELKPGRGEPPDGCIGRPFGGNDDDETFHLVRSRQRPKAFPPNQHWAITDVFNLASQLAIAHACFRSAWRRPKESDNASGGGAPTTG